MLFFFRGQSGPVARVAVGAVLIVAGLLLSHGALFVGLGAVLVVWGGIAALSGRRANRQARIDSSTQRS